MSRIESVDLARNYQYPVAAMGEMLEKICNSSVIGQEPSDIPGVLKGIQDLFGEAIDEVFSREYGTTPKNPVKSITACRMLRDIVCRAENIPVDMAEEGRKEEKEVNSRIKRYSEFITTLDKPRELEPRGKEVADDVLRFFRSFERLLNSVGFGYGGKSSYTYPA